MAEAVKTRRRRRNDPAWEQCRELRECMVKTRAELNAAYAGFNMTSDPDLIDSHVYEINALQSRYSYLVRKLRELEGGEGGA